MKPKPFPKDAGFTLIELVLVIAFLTIILGVVIVNLFKPGSEAKIDSVSADIVSILRETQNRAINTDTQNEATSAEYGVHFEANEYILFKGTSFDASDQDNFVVDTPDGVIIAPNLPCPAPPGDCNNVVFQRISGEVVSFDATKNTICLTETGLGKQRFLRINFVGVVDVLESC